MSGRLKRALSSFWQKLQRRRVIKTTIAYAVGSWVLIEVSATVVPALELPEVAVQYIVMSAIAGLPVVIVLSWMFDIHRGTSRLIELTDTSDELQDAAAIGDATISIPPELDSAITSVAVLPFENLSHDENHKFIAEGIAAELHTTLAKVHQLRVVARNISFASENSDRDIRSRGQKLSAHFIISGSVRCQGEQMRVSVELSNCVDGTQAWSGTFDKKIEDIFDVEREIAESVAAEFGGARMREEIRSANSAATTSVNAWGLVQRARSYVVSFTPKALSEAVPVLRSAIEIDEDYAIAHAALAFVLAEQVLNGFSQSIATDRGEALASAERAMELAPVDPNVMKLCGATWAYFGEANKAIQALRGATELAPFDFGAWGYLGWPLVATGSAAHLEELQKIMARLISQGGSHPGAPYWLYHQSVAFSCQGDNDSAVNAGKKSVERNAAFPWGWMQYANALGATGADSEARAAAARASQISPSLTREHYCEMIRVMSANADVAESRLAGLQGW